MIPLLSSVIAATILAQPSAPPVQITGHVVKPATLDATDERIATLKAPDGLRINVFAKGLGKPRMITVAEDGAVYITRRGARTDGGGDVLMLRDTDGDGVADLSTTAAELDHVHSLAIREGSSEVYAIAINELYRFTRATDGALKDKTLVLAGLPDAGQHPNRTIGFKPGDNRTLYLSVGSTCNACMEPNKLAATMTTVTLPEPGAGITPGGVAPPMVFAKGLRNTIGFAWHPATGQLWGMDHGIDWLGDDEQGEELNKLDNGADYGWPVVYENNTINQTLASELPGGESKESYAARCTPSTLTTTAHSAPMQMAFCGAAAGLGDGFQNDALLALHGSWNRKSPSGYSVARIRFDADGQPKAIEPFITGWLSPTGSKSGGPAVFGRPCGLAFAKDGALLLSDDLNGVIYRVSKK